MEKMVLVVVKEWFAQFTEKLPWNCFHFLLLYLTDPLNVFQPLNTKNNSYFNQNKTLNKILTIFLTWVTAFSIFP